MLEPLTRRRSRTSSLRWRLPVLITALLVSLGLAFTWMAYREMRHGLREAGDERVGYAASQLAGLLAQTASARTAESRRVADDAAVRQFVFTGEGADAAVRALRPMAQRSPQARIWLRARGGTAPTRLALENIVIERGPAGAATEATPAVDGVGPLVLKDDGVAYVTTVIIAPPPGQPDTGSGVLSIERRLSASPGTLLVERLIGSGAVLKFGNASGDLWTNLSASIDAPPTLPAGAPTISFADAAGKRRLGARVAVASTPWAVWVEFSESSLMQPADTLLRRLWPWTVGLILFGVVAIGVASARITTPLEEVAAAADAVAMGDYSRRVASTGDDEVGRLGAAFNVMAERVARSREALEAQVDLRTEELSRSREEMDQFFSMSLDLLSVADLGGQFTRVNPAWEAVLGWSAADLTASPHLHLVHPDDRAATVSESAKLSAGGDAVRFENRYRTKDGEYRWLSWKAVANHARGLVYAIARDVTDEKRAARELQQNAGELTASNQELEAFSYSVSHDLRAPLRSVDGFSQALLEDCGESLTAEGQDHLRRIRAAAQHMGRLIDDLLKLARVTRAELHFEPIDLSAMAETTLAALAQAHRERAVEWHVQPGLLATGDARLLAIALTNLLENAWKFTGKRAQARIEFGMGGGVGQAGEYFIRDNGAGFDDRYATRLFSAFQRLHKSADFPGTGIGLATVRRIVTRHGGQVRAESTAGQGATFLFTLQPGLPA